MSKLKIPKDYYNGEVAKIINEYRILIKPGKEVFSKGDIIQVVEPALEIENNKGEVVDIFSFAKGELKITNVYDDYAIAYSNKKSIVKGFGSLSTFGQDREVISKLPMSEENLNLQLKNSNIKIGDPVVII